MSTKNKTTRIHIPISEEDLDRIQQCVVDSRNLQTCYSETGVAPQTVHRMLQNKSGMPKNVREVLIFCGQVEKLMNESKQAS